MLNWLFFVGITSLGIPNIGAQELQYKWIYHDNLVTWNTASSVCHANGGQLIVLDSLLKMEMVEYFKSQWTQENVLNNDYWVGMFDSKSPDKDYKWIDCNRVDSSLTNWYTADNEPDNPQTEHCVRNRRDDGLWRTKQCNSKYQFICEEISSPCTFDKFEETDIGILASDYTLETVSIAKQEGCVRKCSTSATAMANICWAALFDQANGVCRLYYGLSPLPLLRADKKISQRTTFFIKTCFIATGSTSSISNELNNNDQRPTGCRGSLDIFYRTPETSTQMEVTTTPLLTTERFTTTETLTDTTEQSTDSETKSSQGQMTNEITTLGTSSSSKMTTTPIETTATELPRTTGADETTPGSTAETDVKCALGEEKVCICHRELTPEESRIFMAKILEEISLEKEAISRWKRKYISIPDERPSAQGVGYFGAVVLALIFGGLVLLDITKLMEDFKFLVSQVKQFSIS